jgi:hypothetical protein
MKYRDFNIEYPKPYHNGKQWVYEDSPIYQNLLECFLETQRPEGEKNIREKYGNTRLRDPFRKTNKMNIQSYIGHKDSFESVDWVEDDGKIVAAIIFTDISKMSRKVKEITSFTGQKYQLSTNDSYIKEIACYKGYEEQLCELIKRHEGQDNFISQGITVVECDMQNSRMRSVLESLGYVRKDNLISSFADMYGFWFKGFDGQGIEPAQEISLQRLELDVQETDSLMKQILELQQDFSNHYSNYNKGDSWSGIVIRGYGGREDFIIKPTEMSQSWKKDNPEKMEWKVEDTPIRKKLTEVEKFVNLLPFEHERIRILKLDKGEGELQRHTDRQDKEAGIGDRQWARLHFPLKTNPNVEFTQWNTDGTKTREKMRKGELWYLDMRKPHTAVNFGDEDRYHLIIDCKSTPELRDWLVKSSKKYPPNKQTDDYED